MPRQQRARPRKKRRDVRGCQRMDHQPPTLFTLSAKPRGGNPPTHGMVVQRDVKGRVTPPKNTRTWHPQQWHSRQLKGWDTSLKAYDRLLTEVTCSAVSIHAKKNRRPDSGGLDFLCVVSVVALFLRG